LTALRFDLLTLDLTTRSASQLGTPREIISPGVDEVLLVGVGRDEVEVELVGKGFGEEVGAAGEGF